MKARRLRRGVARSRRGRRPSMGVCWRLAWRLCRRGSAANLLPRGRIRLASRTGRVREQAGNKRPPGEHFWARHSLGAPQEWRANSGRTYPFPGPSGWARLGSNQRPLACETTGLHSANGRFSLQIRPIHPIDGRSILGSVGFCRASFETRNETTDQRSVLCRRGLERGAWLVPCVSAHPAARGYVRGVDSP
jgi:hypothetical protein